MYRTRSPASISINTAALRHVRRLTGLSVTALAREVGVTPSFVSNLEAGRRRSVSPSVFRSLCSALRVEDVRALMANPGIDMVDAA